MAGGTTETAMTSLHQPASREAPRADAPARKIRKSVALGVTAGGAILAVFACFFPTIFGDNYGDKLALTATVLINLGTAFMLAAVLLLIEKWLVERVQFVAAQSASAAVNERADEFTKTTDALSVRVDALQRALENRLSQQDADRYATLAAVAQDASLDSVTAALEEANDVGALATGSITVSASADVDGPRIMVRWAPDRVDDEEEVPQLALWLPDVDQVAQPLRWDPDKDAVAVMVELTKSLRRAGHASLAKKLSPDLFFMHLSSALSEAVRVRTQTDNHWFEGAMYEWLSDGWAITEAGLFSAEHGNVIPQSNIKFVGPPRTGLRLRTDEELFPRPEGVDEKFWKLAIKRTKGHILGARRGVQLGPMAQTTSAYTTATSPRTSEPPRGISSERFQG